MRYNFNAIWAALKKVAPFTKDIQREQDLPFAMDMVRRFQSLPKDLQRTLGRNMLNDQSLLVGADAGYGGESKRWLQPASDAAVSVVTNNPVQFNVLDDFIVDTIGFIFTIAGQTSALVMDFDLHPNLYGIGTVVDKLDTVNGVITAPNVTTAQAIGARVAKDLSQSPIHVTPGKSIATVATTVTTTTGSGMAFVLGFPISEHLLNDPNYFASA